VGATGDAARGLTGPFVYVAVGIAGALLAAVGVLPSYPGHVLFAALPPLDLYSDLRFLLAEARGVLWFVGGLVMSIGVRSTILAVAMGGLNGRTVTRAVGFYMIALVPSALAALAVTMSAALVYSLLFWAGFAVLLVSVLLLMDLPWTRPGRLAFGAAARHGFHAAGVLVTLAAYALLGWFADALGTLGVVIALPLAGGVSGASAWWIRRSSASGREADLRWRFARRVGATAVVAVLFVPYWLIFTGPTTPPEGDADRPPREGSLMLMSGVDSGSGDGAIFETDPRMLGYTCEQTYYYSYAGPGDGAPQGEAACPIRTGAPYGPEDTMRHSDELVPFLEQQLEGLPGPVTLAGHSQGVWVVRRHVNEGPAENLGVAVLVGTFPENPMPYPAEDLRGRGALLGQILIALADVPRPGGTAAFHPQADMAVEYLADPRAIDDVMQSPPGGQVRSLSVKSVFDLPLMTDPEIPFAENLCPVPAIHPDMPYSPDMLERIDAFLDGREEPRCPTWRSAYGPLSRTFMPAPRP
jgi:hypothetical protein